MLMINIHLIEIRVLKKLRHLLYKNTNSILYFFILNFFKKRELNKMIYLIYM